MATVGIGGCAAGLLVGIGVGMRAKGNTNDSSSVSLDNKGSGGVAPAGNVGIGINAHYSPSRFMSPPTHLRRATPAAEAHGSISQDVFLTRQMADFDRAAGLSRDLDTEEFIDILGKLIGETSRLQNNPRLNITPQEKYACDHVINMLKPYSTANGGPLIIEELEYVSGRPNLKVVYPGTGTKTVSFVGSHFDVVPADAETWSYDPFKLTVCDDGKLYGRGTTDCLGHVALLSTFLAELGRKKPNLKRSVIVCFIAAEEGGEKGVGVDMVVGAGKLEEGKKGPVYWVDCADSQPCCGTLGVLSWSLTAHGRVIHSGFPQKGINSIELASEAIGTIQSRFYEDFPPSTGDDAYGFLTGSHMKPTQIECAKGGLNQICPSATVHGDIRLSPFYEVEDVVEAVDQYVEDLNAEMEVLPSKGPYSKFVLGDDVTVNDGELKRGKLEIKWNGSMETAKLYAGVACDLKSEGHRALVQACRETFASVKPFSITGSLPLVNSMKKAGFDLQLLGFGLMSVYHGVNEYCTLEDMQKAYEVLLRTICLLESNA